MKKAPQPSARLKVKVVPRSSRNVIVGWLRPVLKIEVTAPPEKGRANEAVVQLLSDRLGLSPDAIAMTSRHQAAARFSTMTSRTS